MRSSPTFLSARHQGEWFRNCVPQASPDGLGAVRGGNCVAATAPYRLLDVRLPVRVACGGCSDRECPPNPPACTSSSQAIICVAPRCSLVMEPDATPPHALMKLGSDTVIELTPINTVPAPCLTSVVGSSLVWVSSDPSLATVHGIGTSDVATVTALSPGDTEISRRVCRHPGSRFERSSQAVHDRQHLVSSST